jgi:hypothetical protein
MLSCRAVAMMGQVAAVGGGVFATAYAQLKSANGQGAAAAMDKTSIAGLLVAIGGLATAIGAQIQPMLQLWISERRAEREQKWARHDLANKLQAAYLRISYLEHVVAENQAAIHKNAAVSDAILESGLIPPAPPSMPVEGPCPPPDATGPPSSS